MTLQQTKYKFILVAQMIFNNAKSKDFEKGIQTSECKSLGAIYDIKSETLMPYVSYIKYFNKVNSSSFKIRNSYKKTIELINPMNNDELLDLLDILEESEKDFDLLTFLINTKKEDKK